MSSESDVKDFPAAVRRWNWGAFWMTWAWGLGNRTYVALLGLIPVVSLVMMFVLGAKGGAWAWKNGKWANTEHFTRVQGLWAAFGFGLFAGCLIMLALFTAMLVFLFNSVFM